MVVLGPTGVGKSRLLYRDLEDRPLHVVSADSMEIYRGFDVATDTPSRRALETFPHTAVNELSPSEDYSVADFTDRARRGLQRARETGRIPTVVGGTALYIKAFLFGLDEMPPANPDYRRRLRRRAEEQGDEVLHEQLREVDPRAARRIHPNDHRRIIRALEIYHETGRTKSQLTRGDRAVREEIDPFVVGLHRPREELHRRIRRRAHRMMERGLVDEVRRLRAGGDPGRTVRQAIGYRAACRYLDGEIDREDVVDVLVEKTRKLIRKQRSWFRRFPVDAWFHPEREREEVIRAVDVQLERTQPA